MFQTKVAKKFRIRIICSITFPEIRAVCDTVWRNKVEVDGLWAATR